MGSDESKPRKIDVYSGRNDYPPKPQTPQQHQIPEKINYEDMKLDQFGLSRHIPKLISRLDDEYLVALRFWAGKTYEAVVSSDKFKSLYRSMFAQSGAFKSQPLQQIKNYLCCLSVHEPDLVLKLPRALSSVFQQSIETITSESILSIIMKLLVGLSTNQTKFLGDALNEFNQGKPQLLNSYLSNTEGFTTELLSREAIKKYIMEAFEIQLKGLCKQMYQQYLMISQHNNEGQSKSELNILIKKGERYDRLPEEFEKIRQKYS